MLLLQDKNLPSIATLIAGEPVRGSWWSHPKSHAIWAVAEQLDKHPDVLITRLIGGKVTYVHRKLWPDFLLLASSQERWQMSGLSPRAKRLLDRVQTEGRIQATGPDSKELQNRLLVHAEEMHTQSGKHETMLQTWEEWRKGKSVRPRSDLGKAKQVLEAAAKGIGAPLSSLAWLKER